MDVARASCGGLGALHRGVLFVVGSSQHPPQDIQRTSLHQGNQEPVHEGKVYYSSQHPPQDLQRTSLHQGNQEPVHEGEAFCVWINR